MAAELQKILDDPNFRNMAEADRVKVWAKLDPNFARMVPDDQLKVLRATSGPKPPPSPIPPPGGDTVIDRTAEGLGRRIIPGYQGTPLNPAQAPVSEGLARNIESTGSMIQGPPGTFEQAGPSILSGMAATDVRETLGRAESGDLAGAGGYLGGTLGAGLLAKGLSAIPGAIARAGAGKEARAGLRQGIVRNLESGIGGEQEALREGVLAERGATDTALRSEREGARDAIAQTREGARMAAAGRMVQARRSMLQERDQLKDALAQLGDSEVQAVRQARHEQAKKLTELRGQGRAQAEGAKGSLQTAKETAARASTKGSVEAGEQIGRLTDEQFLEKTVGVRKGKLDAMDAEVDAAYDAFRAHPKAQQPFDVTDMQQLAELMAATTKRPLPPVVTRVLAMKPKTVNTPASTVLDDLGNPTREATTSTEPIMIPLHEAEDLLGWIKKESGYNKELRNRAEGMAARIGGKLQENIGEAAGEANKLLQAARAQRRIVGDTFQRKVPKNVATALEDGGSIEVIVRNPVKFRSFVKQTGDEGLTAMRQRVADGMIEKATNPQTLDFDVKKFETAWNGYSTTAKARLYTPEQIRVLDDLALGSTDALAAMETKTASELSRIRQETTDAIQASRTRHADFTEELKAKATSRRGQLTQSAQGRIRLLQDTARAEKDAAMRGGRDTARQMGRESRERQAGVTAGARERIGDMEGLAERRIGNMRVRLGEVKDEIKAAEGPSLATKALRIGIGGASLLGMASLASRTRALHSLLGLVDE